ncbi:cysteine-rich CWC family protein [Diaphorobacter sp.]|uniref:cysteine-rich CWC family protein n=1 Tax=Diaphorobacter sp. TaxID=1934310 RepID=UPI0028AA7216|nr:cysteine-rich CWC family protein [Diaphorobacter sp.]
MNTAADTTPASPPPGRCPLCGQSNQCAITAGQPPDSCWCMQTPVSREALARIPSAQRGKTCICPHCAQPVDDTSILSAQS